MQELSRKELNKLMEKQQQEVDSYFRESELKLERKQEKEYEKFFLFDEFIIRKLHNLKSKHDKGIKRLQQLSLKFLTDKKQLKRAKKRLEILKIFSNEFIDYCRINRINSFNSSYLIKTFHNSIRQRKRQRENLIKIVKSYLIRNELIEEKIIIKTYTYMKYNEPLVTIDYGSYNLLLKKWKQNKHKKTSGCISVNSLSWKLRTESKRVKNLVLV